GKCWPTWRQAGQATSKESWIWFLPGNLQVPREAPGRSRWDQIDFQVNPIKLSRRWEQALLHQLFTELDTKRIIDIKHLDGDAANRRATDKACSLPPEMPRPLVPTRVKQRR